ncbi:MAG: hypothetical protein LBR21_05130 [Propionibacteriaceae bacterium]|jgi:hypothetical protein|nr:hypothetical protein [Propionibacteriaceae bacterium]
MNVPPSFGELIYHGEPEKGHRAAAAGFLVLAISFALFLLLIGIAGIVSPARAGHIAFGIFCLLAGALLLTLCIIGIASKSSRRYTIDVYEHGLVLTEQARKRSLTFHYDDLEGIQCREPQTNDTSDETPDNDDMTLPWIGIFPKGPKRKALRISWLSDAAPWLDNAYTEHVLNRHA